MSRSKSAPMISPEESSSSDTNQRSDDLLLEEITISQTDNSVICLVPGQLYHDFSGEEPKSWLSISDISETPDSSRTINASNQFGVTLLYLGHRTVPWALMWQAPAIYGYFLSKDKLLCLPIICDKHPPKYLRLWPANEEAHLKRNVY